VLDDRATDSDQVEGGPGEDVFIFGQTAEESLLIMRSEVFADDDRLLGRCLVEGNSLGPIVALQLCLFMLFSGWAGRLGDLALRREAVYVPLPWDKVSFYIARGLLVAVVSVFRDRGVPKPTSEISPRAPAQMGRHEAEREGGK
jgi:hypothetical protein